LQTIEHPATSPVNRRWLARLSLEVEADPDRSVLRKSTHIGPLRVQRAFYPESDGTCHVYLLHPPGGVVQGDELEVHVTVGANARCLLTTPGATKLYRCDEKGSRILNRIAVRDGARCDWVPQECIAFNGATSFVKTVVELHGRSEYLGWDIVCLGRPAAGELFERGLLCFEQSVTRDGAPLLSERLVVSGSGSVLQAAWGFDGFSVLGTLLVATGEMQWVDWVRQHVVVADDPHIAWSGSELEGISVFRALGRSAEAVRSVLFTIWDACRRRLGSDGHHSPRIWKL